MSLKTHWGKLKGNVCRKATKNTTEFIR